MLNAHAAFSKRISRTVLSSSFEIRPLLSTLYLKVSLMRTRNPQGKATDSKNQRGFARPEMDDQSIGLHPNPTYRCLCHSINPRSKKNRLLILYESCVMEKNRNRNAQKLDLRILSISLNFY